MTPIQVIFLISSALILVGALMVVTRRNLVHAAFYLVMTLFGVAVLFVLLDAGFLAAVQVVVYIGAIAILLIIGVMVTRNVTGTEVKTVNKNFWLASAIALMVFSSIFLALNQWSQFNAPAAAVNAEILEDTVINLGVALVDGDQFVIPFEVASILLLGALVGAIVIAWPRKTSEE
jgi:NADH-quinone oxidoreductase subunit J